MDIHYFVGIDIAKATLDWAIYTGKKIVLQTSTPNSVTGIKTALRLLKALPDWNPKQAVFCMEHTGIYNAHLLDFLHKLHFPIWLESSLQIKKAGGLQRGKTDSIDAQRIAEYAYRFCDQIRLWEAPRQVIQKLALLSAARQRLISVYNQLAGPLAEHQGFIDPTLQKQLNKSCQVSLTALEKDRKAVDRAIGALIEADPRLSQLFELVVSVTGIGTATATEIVIATNEMKTITDPKKMACHAGVAPFSYQSGSSVRGRPGVSQHARKRLKSLFHLGAMSAIRAKGELQDYYQRKVKEGKNKMLVLNAVRNKLIHRVYAVVAKGEKYDKNYVSPLA
ncbi:IS110 family RNA-guided transposase [Spirosoma rhododendri]|uniref:IS110 family transposase n=1 Tax=Spirosoma rhododendri TaxID=2728024 RepID=A0A7L5DR17_9BACT|nr:IS110 family transposase [Spirosoma rhododendri]QJD79663.1 IS110 family transposase [Spirosoma rhododendri]